MCVVCVFGVILVYYTSFSLSDCCLGWLQLNLAMWSFCVCWLSMNKTYVFLLCFVLRTVEDRACWAQDQGMVQCGALVMWHDSCFRSFPVSLFLRCLRCCAGNWLRSLWRRVDRMSLFWRGGWTWQLKDQAQPPHLRNVWQNMRTDQISWNLDRGTHWIKGIIIWHL